MKETLFFVAFLFVFSGFVQAQNAEEIVAKYLAAIGADHWAKINTIKMEAKITAKAAPGMEIPWTMTASRDKAARMEVSVMNNNQVTVVNGDTGWSTNPSAGKTDPKPMTASQVASMKDVTDIDGTLVGYKEKGYTLEYVGTEDVDGTEAIVIKVTKPKKTEYSFFDPASFYEIKRETVEEVDGQTLRSAVLYSNFTTQEGIVMSFTMQELGSENVMTITLVVFNPAVDDQIFAMPTK